jgi:hypothetical protein
MKKADCLVHGDILGGLQSTRKLRVARLERIEVISQSDFFQILDREKHLRRSQR